MGIILMEDFLILKWKPFWLDENRFCSPFYHRYQKLHLTLTKILPTHPYSRLVNTYSSQIFIIALIVVRIQCTHTLKKRRINDNNKNDNKHFHSLKLRENVLIIFYYSYVSCKDPHLVHPLFSPSSRHSHVILWVHKHIYFKLHQMQFSLPFYFCFLSSFSRL